MEEASSSTFEDKWPACLEPSGFGVTIYYTMCFLLSINKERLNKPVPGPPFESQKVELQLNYQVISLLPLLGSRLNVDGYRWCSMTPDSVGSYILYGIWITSILQH